MVLVKNLKIFYLSILGKTGQNNTSHDILEGKNVCLDNKNKKLKKSKKQNFSKRNSPWVLSKNFKFFWVFIWGNILRENAYYDVLPRENAFQDYKNKNLIKSRNEHFLNGLVHGFGQKFKLFFLSILDKTGEKNTFHDILERKNVYLDNKNKKLKKSKN